MFPPATDDQLDALAVKVGLNDLSALPSEMVDWFRWAGGVDFPPVYLDQFWGSDIAFSGNGWSAGSGGLESMKAVGDPDMEAVRLLVRDGCEVAVSTRASDAGSLWLRDAEDGRYGLLWDSIDEMLDCLLALVADGHIAINEHGHLRLVNQKAATVPLPRPLKQSFYQDWPV